MGQPADSNRCICYVEIFLYPEILRFTSPIHQVLHSLMYHRVADLINWHLKICIHVLPEVPNCVSSRTNHILLVCGHFRQRLVMAFWLENAIESLYTFPPSASGSHNCA